MNCKYCQTPIPEGSRFCPGCGVRLQDAAAEHSAAPKTADPIILRPAPKSAKPDLPQTPSARDERSSSVEEHTAAESKPSYQEVTYEEVLKKHAPQSMADSQEPAAAHTEPEPDFASQPVSASSTSSASASSGSRKAAPGRSTSADRKPGFVFKKSSEAEKEEEKQRKAEERQARKEARKARKEERNARYEEEEEPSSLNYEAEPGYLPEEDDDDDWDYENDNQGGIAGKILAGAASIVAVLLCFAIAYLCGWIRLPFAGSADSPSEPVADTQPIEEPAPTPEEPASGQDTFQEAFDNNNDTQPAPEEPQTPEEPVQTPSAGTVYISNQNMNVRSEPNVNSARLGSVAAGSSVTIVETVDGEEGTVWGKTSDGGYVCLSENGYEYMTLDPNQPVSQPSVPEQNLTENQEPQQTPEEQQTPESFWDFLKNLF